MLLTLLTCNLSSIFGHPPSDISFVYNLENKTVEINVQHKVKNIEDHYIDKVTIFLNGKKIIEQVSLKQLNNDTQIYIFKIPELKENDKIVVLAKCNKFGDLKKK